MFVGQKMSGRLVECYSLSYLVFNNLGPKYRNKVGLNGCEAVMVSSLRQAVSVNGYSHTALYSSPTVLRTIPGPAR